MSNLTFDDGEPIDVSKLQALYQEVLTLKGEVAKNTIQNQNVRLTPITYASSTTEGIKLKLDVVGSIVIDYSAAKFEAGAKPSVIVTPRISTIDKVKAGSFSYFVTDVTSSSAKIAAYSNGKTLDGATINFDYIVVYMRSQVS